MTSPDSDPDPAPGPLTARLFTCAGCVIAGPLGCLAFVGGALAVLLVKLPGLVSEHLVHWVPSVFDQSFEGSLELAGVELSWRERQVLDGLVLRDPSGVQVGSASIELPSLLDFFDFAFSEEEEAGTVAIQLDAELVADDEGVTNLERAFAQRDDYDVELDLGDSDPDLDRDDLLELLFASRFVLEVDVARLSWSDRLTRARGEPLVLRDLALALTTEPDAPARLDVEGTLVQRAEGRLELHASLAQEAFESTRAGRRSGATGPGLVLSFSAESVPTAYTPRAANLSRAFGESVGLALDLRAATEDGSAPLSFEISSQRGGIDFEGRVESRPLFERQAWSSGTPLRRIEGQVALERVPGELFGPLLPADAELDFGASRSLELRAEFEPERGGPLLEAVDALDAAARDHARPAAEVARGEAIEPPPASTATGARWLARCVVEADVPELAYADPALRAAGCELRATGVRALVTGLGGESPALALDGRTAGADGVLRHVVQWRSALLPGTLDLLDARVERRRVPAAVRTEAEAFPTAVLDAWLGSGDFLARLLGSASRLDLELRPAPEGPPRLDVWLASEHARIDLAGARLGATALEGERAELRFDLGAEAASSAMLGALLPMLEGVRARDGADPGRLTLSDYVLPLDGEPAALTGRAVLELGTVEYAVRSQLDAFLHPPREPRLERAAFGPLTLRLAGGAVELEEQAFGLRRSAVPFDGRYALDGSDVALQVYLPIELVGPRISPILFENRRVLQGGGYEVPVEITGTWDALEVQVVPSFMGWVRAMMQQLPEPVLNALDKLREEQ